MSCLCYIENERREGIEDMLKKKTKSSQKLKRRTDTWHAVDVQVNTGLPPQVEGQLRCFCRVSVTQITWHIPNPPNVTFVCLKWWGEPGNGILFRPVDARHGSGNQAKTTARYPVRSGPKQFTAYLADMGSLVLGVLSGPMRVSIGNVEVPNLGQLAPNRPINGLYPIISGTREGIGELHVSLVLESLMDCDDSCGSIPTTDVSMETFTSHATQESTFPKQSRPVPHSDQPKKPEEDPFISPASHQHSSDERLVKGYADELRHNLSYEMDAVPRYIPVQKENTVATSTINAVTTNLKSETANQMKEQVDNTQASQKPIDTDPRNKDKDLLSVLLDRGNKLREQMIVSALGSKSESGQLSSVSKTGLNLNMSLRSSADGSLLPEIHRVGSHNRTSDDDNLDDAAVDLVFGDQLTDDIRALKNLDGSPNESTSGDDDILSDVEDPIHSQSILNELFYRNQSSASELSDLSADEVNVKIHKDMEDESNMRPPSRSSSVSSLNLAFPPEPELKKAKAVNIPKRRSRVKVKKKGQKRRKWSKSRTNTSECSDSDAMSTGSTSRSESSRVSFDMIPSDIDDVPSPSGVPRQKKSQTVDGLSVERLTLLGRVHVARVTIEQLQLLGHDLDSSAKPKASTKTGTRSPKPSTKGKKSCAYFIEYQFPVVATSRDKYSPNAMATEVMRVVSKNIKNGVVKFSHRSVFPVMFDGSTVESWWKSALVFKLYSRLAGQKVPSLIGSCGVSLKAILKSESLYIGKDLEVRQSDKFGNTSLNGSKLGPDGLLGKLKVAIELASDNKDFPTQLARTKLAEMTGKAKIVPIAQTPSAAKPSDFKPLVHSVTRQKEPLQEAPKGGVNRSSSRSPERKLVESGLSALPPVPAQHYHGNQSILYYLNHQDGEVMTLHALLMIPDGKNITIQGVPSVSAFKMHPVVPSSHTISGAKARDLCVRNCYLVCRMFWCDEVVHSAVCWGSSEPQFKFQQVAPVLMSQSLLERLKNNFMIVEVWDKKTSSDNDQLVGIVKLSLHQLYMSFRDKRISAALLKSQNPVIAVENYLPIVNVFTGSHYGYLNVLLALGSADQVSHLVRLKTEGTIGVTVAERPKHYLERHDLQHQENTDPVQIGTECVVEHVFEIMIEGVRGLNFDNMIWGEVDCFIQYHFPAQQHSQPPGSAVISHAVPTMKTFRTASTLCIADPTFQDITRHRILLPQGIPVQRELLTACANAGDGSGSLQFELWCRYYHPNVRDQCMAKGSLPLAKLCAMITMQKRGEPSVQTFSFPLTHLHIEEQKNKSRHAGLVDVTIHYKNQVIQSETSIAAAHKNLAGSQVCISVTVVRACGLKAAAESAAHFDQGMQYPAEVGVNSFVKVKLSFLGADGERITRTVARSFTPEFCQSMDFPCSLLWTEANSDALCLAEILETAEIVFEVWHQVPGLSSELDRELNAMITNSISARNLVEKTSDVLLGTTMLPLVSLLSKSTGITGWYPVNIPVSEWNQEPADEMIGTSGLQRIGGGLEVSVKFAHHVDRERVINSARGLGWSPLDVDIEQDGWESEDENSNHYHHINITIDHVTFPLQNALIVGQNTLDKTAQCYVRYKFYDKAAVMTKFAPVSVNSNGFITSQPRNKHDLQIPHSSMFQMYLRENMLEVQVWVTYGKHKGEPRPKHRDKLIGSAYIAMETLCDQRRKQHRISGMYPLYKPGACNLGGAYIRAHIQAKPQFGRNNQSECQDGLVTLDGEDIDVDFDPDDSFHRIQSCNPSQKQASPQKQEVVPEEEDFDTEDKMSKFTAVIQVERALHLPHMYNKQTNDDYLPNSYVSYQTAESTTPSYTSVFHNSDCPVWDHEQETKLCTEMLTVENKSLVFKVCHKPDGAPPNPDKLTDRVLGSVSVDLTPLASGLQQISGWYNIMDFNGQIKGQIKINVIPQETVTLCQGSLPATDPTLYPPTAAFLSMPFSRPDKWVNNDGPLSLPDSNMPHFQQHYYQVQYHHQMLQQQLQDHIQQFLQQQEECEGQQRSATTTRSPVTNVTQEMTNITSSYFPETSIHHGEPLVHHRNTSIHWKPNFPTYMPEESSSRSFLFTSLRKQMQDLDEITSNLRAKLCHTESNTSPDFDVPVTGWAQHGPLTSTLSTVSSFDLARSQHETPREDLANTGSNGAESCRTAGDSGAYSVDHSGEKYEESAPTSQRSVSDRMDTLRSGVTPRDFLDSGINNTNNYSNIEETEQNVLLTISPRRESIDRKDEYSESGGFSFKGITRDPLHTPRDSRNSPRDFQQNSNGNYDDLQTKINSNSMKEVREALYRSEQKQMSIIPEFSEKDSVVDDDEDNKYYRRYEDMLDREEEAENANDDEEDGEIIVPRRINDVSSKISQESKIKMLTGGNNLVPDEVQNYPNTRYEDSRHLLVEVHDIQEDTESDTEMVPKETHSVLLTNQEQVNFHERDSWMSDSDKEVENVGQDIGYRYLHNREHLLKLKRQDSDTGYSSRDNVSESYLTPSAGGTNSETDMPRFHEHGHWDRRYSDDRQDKSKMCLLSNVELESTGDSIGVRYDQTQPHSRISSAGSRQTGKSSEPSVSESFDEKEEAEYLKTELEPIHSARKTDTQPVLAKTSELEDFFSTAKHKFTSEHSRARTSSESSQYSDDCDKNMDDRSCDSARLNSDKYNGANIDLKSTPRTPQGASQNQSVPNFFMPVHHLEESLKTLQVFTNKIDPCQQKERATFASEMVLKLTTKDKIAQLNTKSRLPTAEETKRIAKIFSSKFS